jgi:DNA-binding NarL/FixJ family response regulator
MFLDRTEFEVVGTVSDLGSLGRQAEALLPDLIVVDVKPVGTGIDRLVASIKQSSPLSKLILSCPIEDLSRAARKCGADAYLNDEKLTGQLVRTARTLADCPKIVNGRH